MQCLFHVVKQTLHDAEQISHGEERMFLVVFCFMVCSLSVYASLCLSFSVT